MTTAEWEALTQDPAWQAAVDEAEQQAGCVLSNGFQKRGWMTTWPELPTYSHYMQLRSLVRRSFDAILANSPDSCFSGHKIKAYGQWVSAVDLFEY